MGSAVTGIVTRESHATLGIAPSSNAAVVRRGRGTTEIELGTAWAITAEGAAHANDRTTSSGRRCMVWDRFGRPEQWCALVSCQWRRI